MQRLTSSSIVLACAASLGAVAAVTASTQSSQDSVDAHVAAARKAAGSDYLPVFNDLCGSVTSAPAPPQAPARAPASMPSGDPPRDKWHVEPAKVFDNLYYLGQTEYTAWGVTTSAGIIVIDPLFEYSVEDEVVNGLTTLGLNPRDIKYVLVSHGHRDHVGGARLLQERYGARVIMSAADWDLVLGSRDTYPKPKRDIVAADGQQLTLGDTSITMYLTPGHTPGTISILVPVKDHGQPHLAAQWGGTGFNFTITPEHQKPYWYKTYAESAARFSEAVSKAGADVQIANHPSQDGAAAKLAALAKRQTGEPHPYVIGNTNMQRYLTMVRECALAGVASSR